MTNKIKAAFSEVRAEADLKEQTKQYIKQQRSSKQGLRRGIPGPRFMGLSLAILMMLVVGSGIAAYFTPVAAISIDAENSIELHLNRFDRVVKFEQYGEVVNDAIAHMMHSDYTEAVELILANPVMSSEAEGDSSIEITIACKDDAKVGKMMQQIETQVNKHQYSIKMFKASAEEQQHAHQESMSLGKHRMYQVLLEQNPQLQPEEILDYSMSDLHQMMESGMSDTMPHHKKHPTHRMNHH